MFDNFNEVLDENLIFIFFQGIINLVIIQPTIVSKDEFTPSWANLSLIRVILFIMAFIFNSFYSLMMSVIIITDVHSKISQKFNYKIYGLGLLLVILSFFVVKYEEVFDWRWLSLAFLLGGYSFKYLLNCINEQYKNSLSVFYHWFYSAGYMLVLSQFNSEISKVREIQVYFGVTAMFVSLIEFNSLKGSEEDTGLIKYLIPLLVSFLLIIMGFNIVVALSFLISYEFFILSVSRIIKFKKLGLFMVVNKSHLYAFICQLILVSTYYIFRTNIEKYFESVICMMIVLPLLIFYLNTLYNDRVRLF
jgi:hypothetical protein